LKRSRRFTDSISDNFIPNPEQKTVQSSQGLYRFLIISKKYKHRKFEYIFSLIQGRNYFWSEISKIQQCKISDEKFGLYFDHSKKIRKIHN